MIAYRFCSSQFSSSNLLLNGVGAANNGRRWNELGTRAAYCGTAVELCISEIGYYTIISQVDSILARLSFSKKPTKAMIDNAIEQPFVMSKMRLSEDLNICDLTDKFVLKETLLKHDLPDYSVNDYRKSPYALLENQWTQFLGSRIYQEGYHGLYAKSARSNSGKVLVLFSSKLLPSQVDVLEQKTYRISAIDSRYRKISIRSKPVRDQVLCEDEMGSRSL